MLLVAVCALLGLVVCSRVASRHAVETEAPRRVVLLVSAVVAGCAASPVLVAVLASGGDLRFPLAVAAAVFPLALLDGTRFLRPPVRLPGVRVPVPRVDDAGLLERIEQLATRLGLERPPIVRLVRSAEGRLHALAGAGGLFRPTLAVTDGIVHRLDPDERDAIVAHELAHVATGSIWVLMVTAVCGWAVAVPLVRDGSFLIAFLVLANVQSILVRTVQRRYEVVCDRAAARVVGHEVVLLALAKLHRAHVLPERGLLPFLFHATATHPHQDVRAAELLGDPEGPADADPSRVRRSVERAVPHRLASAAFFLLWCALVVVAVVHSDRDDLRPLLAALLVLAIAQQPLLQLALFAGKRRRLRRRLGRRSASTRWFAASFLVAAIGIACSFLPGPLGSSSLPLFVAGAAGIFGASLARRRQSSLRRRMWPALAQHDFREAIVIAESAPERLARDPALQHDVAVCRALLGEREAAVADLTRVEAASPEVRLASISLALLLLPRDPTAALSRADALTAALPEDPIGPVLRGRALVRLGRIDDAAAAASEALARDPEEASAHTVLVSVHLARGDVEAAAEACRAAFELEPGAADVKLARARLAVASESREQARRLVGEAVEAAEATPLAFLLDEARELEAALDARVEARGGGAAIG